MTTDLWMLVYTALLSMFFFFAYLPGRASVPGGSFGPSATATRPLPCPRGRREPSGLTTTW